MRLRVASGQYDVAVAVGLSVLAAAYAKSGRRDEALRLLNELEEKYAKREANGADLAIVHAALGEDDQALNSLEKDFETGSNVFLAYITNLTSLHERLRNNPRYQNLPGRMGLKLLLVS